MMSVRVVVIEWAGGGGGARPQAEGLEPGQP